MKRKKSPKTKLHQSKVIESLPAKMIDELDLHSGGYIATQSSLSNHGLDAADLARNENLHCVRGKSFDALRLELVIDEAE